MDKPFHEFGSDFANGWWFTNADPKLMNDERVAVCLLAAAVVELQKLNRLLRCENFRDIPTLLRLIRANTAKPRRKNTRPRGGKKC